MDGSVSDQFQAIALGPFAGVTSLTLAATVDLGAIPRGNICLAAGAGRQAIHDTRAAMSCSELQGRLTLGPEVCAMLDAMATNPLTPWAMRQTIAKAGTWYRLSQSIDELGYLLGFDDAQMDDLFVAAAKVVV